MVITNPSQTYYPESVLFKQKISAATSLILMFMLLFPGCGKPTVDHWSEFIPGSSLYLIVPEENNTLSQMLDAPYMPMFDDISPAAVQLVSTLQDETETPIQVEALLLYPDTSNEWQPVWITRTVEGLKDQLTSLYQRDFEQNRYEFERYTVEKLFLPDRVIFLIEVGEWFVFSESSLAIENILRTVSGTSQPVSLSRDQIAPGSVIFNTSSLDVWVKQLAHVSLRPNLTEIFKGTNPASFRFHQGNGEWEWQMRSSLKLDNEKSNLIRLFSSVPESFTLDRYISVNAAAFALFRSDPVRLSLDNLETELDADEYLTENDHYIRDLRQHLGHEVGFVSFADSGPESDSEYLYLRTIQSPSGVMSVLDRLESEGLVTKADRIYHITSKKLGKLFGSEINPMDNFYITVYDQVVALSQRNGLAESVGGDAERRRVMFYDDDYSKIRNSNPNSLSSIVYVDGPRFSRFIQPWLDPVNYFGSFSGSFDQFVITTELQADEESMQVNLTNFEREHTERPNREQWVFPLGDADIAGPAVLADITGSGRNEVVFSTDEGSVYVLASDGTAIVQMLTNDDIPIGQPVVYDWYGNNQNVIMQAAGDKVYAWNQNGDLLPNFPVVLNEEITTPLTVKDVTGNGMAEMIIATADRNVHILNARGQALSGWPQSTNSVVRSRPLIESIRGQQALLVFAENALHGWNVNGQLLSNYPVFLSAQMQGSPAKYNNHILGSGLDGSLYSVGPSALFADTLSTTHMSETVYVQSLPVSNSSLNSTPTVHDEMLRGDDGLYREDLILLQSSNGSVFLYNTTGELRFSESLGQPGSASFSPKIADINGDERRDVVALADFGRLYAWDLLSAERHLDLPTAGMRHPLISDFYGDGNPEIIAQTREGLQCWTIFFTRREAAE
ncbi:MAG: hypothetical protein JJU13_00700 [Balneolaceae bacterium]|nr:hypothetical protein [Balneolaceae bacterium]